MRAKNLFRYITRKAVHYYVSLRRSVWTNGLEESLASRITYFLFSVNPKLACIFNSSVGGAISMSDLNRLVRLSNEIGCKKKYFCEKNLNFKGPTLRMTFSEEFRRLRDDGYTKIPIKMNSYVEQVMEGIKNYQFYPSNVPIGCDNSPRILADGRFNYYCTDPLPDFTAGALEVLLSDPALYQLIHAYLGGAPKIYSVNNMLTIKSQLSHSVTDLHRDFDDDIFLSLFVYWTPVSKSSGATCYVPGSHVKEAEGVDVQYLEGAAGEVYLVDPYGLHAGNKLTDYRFVTWIRFSKNRLNLASFSDKSYLYFKEFERLFPLYS